MVYSSSLSDKKGIVYDDSAIKIMQDSINNLTTVDSRHSAVTYRLREYFSEAALHKYRTKVELIHLLTMAEHGGFSEISPFSEEDKDKLYGFIQHFGIDDARAIQEYDHVGRHSIKATEHDVKSVEYYIKEKFDDIGMSEYKPFVHQYCTSEDINNIAYQCMLRDALNDVMLPKLRGILEYFSHLIETHKTDALMSRTHGQPASPTTFGKEIAVFTDRIRLQVNQLEKLVLDIKFNGAVGNYNSHVLAKPQVDWIDYGNRLAEQFGFENTLLTGQRGPMLARVQLFQIIQNINRVLFDFCRDIWSYNKDKLVYHIKKDGEVGSSVMPQKVNPWFLEEAEGCLVAANDIFDTQVKNNDVSRLQRDMSGHPHERNFGDAFGHTLIAWTNILESLERIQFDKSKALEELNFHPEIITEGIQTILRREKQDNAYELLKELSRGKNLTMGAINSFIHYLGYTQKEKEEAVDSVHEIVKDFSLPMKALYMQTCLPKHVIDEMQAIRPNSFIGLAPLLAEKANNNLIETMALFDAKVIGTTKQRILGVFSDFDNTLQLGDKEELIAKMQYVNNRCNLGLSDAELTEIAKKSDYNEIKQEMIKLRKNIRLSIDIEDLTNATKEITGKNDHLFYLDTGSKELLDLLHKKGIKTAIISTRGNTSLQRVAREKYGVDKTINVILGREDVQQRKPSPEGINKALETLNINPSTGVIFYLGDKFAEDVYAAQRAGITPMYIKRGDEIIDGDIANHDGKILEFANMREAYHYFFRALV